MKLLNYIYLKLRSANQVRSATEFSTFWCNKNANWYAYQNYMGNDFSLGAAINCLSKLRQEMASQKHRGTTQQIQELENLLVEFLRLKHRVADIVGDEAI